jgi:hypothetical protein
MNKLISIKTMGMVFFILALVFAFAGCPTGGGTDPGGYTPTAEDIADFGAGVTPTFINAPADLKTALEGLTAGNYVITLNTNVTLDAAIVLDTTNIKVSLRGGGKTITLDPSSSDNHLFDIDDPNAMLIVRDVTLQGDGSVYLGFRVTQGTLVLEDGAELTGFMSAVDVAAGGEFLMKDGKIHGNTSGSDSPVKVRGGTFTMEGGEISGNTTIGSSGGVIVMASGEFTLKGGSITGNAGDSGGGVKIINGTFTMEGGEIFDNTADYDGGAVEVSTNGKFTMTGGEILGNTAVDSAGGVFVAGNNAVFEKFSGVIYGSDGGVKANTVTAGDDKGHAVYVHVVGNTNSLYRDTTSANTDTLKATLNNNGDAIASDEGTWEIIP